MTGLLPAVSTQLPLCFSLHRHKSFTVAPPQLSVAKAHRQQQQRLSPFMSFSSLSTCSTGSITEQEQTEESSPLPSPPSSLVESVVDGELLLSSSGCKACGREQIERGCNGEGRIQGGIATVPGFGWWPIKAYRPCPGFLASGGNYRRRGQSMDEVAFGGGKRGTSMDDTDELENRNKGNDRRRFKR